MADVLIDWPKSPTSLTHEQRILAVLEDIKHEMVLARLERWGRVNEPQTPTIDTEPVLGLARKPGSAIVKPKGRR